MKKILSILFLMACGNLFAQVDLVIGDNMQVETSGGTYIEVSGDVVEDGTGYLLGVVKSGSRVGETSFAGLDFSQGFTGEITRTTGTEYSSNGAGTNVLRNYQLDNTGSALTANLDAEIASSETNSLDGPYYLYTYNSSWTGNGDGSSGTTVSANSVQIPSGTTDLVISEGTGVSAKIMLEGPYSTSANNMNTTINANIPSTSPYVEDPRTVASVPSNAVDWVLVQLKETATGAVVESRSAFIGDLGNLIKDDGTAGIGIKSAPGDYFVVIKHRNHLGVMTTNAITGLTWGTN